MIALGVIYTVGPRIVIADAVKDRIFAATCEGRVWRISVDGKPYGYAESRGEAMCRIIDLARGGCDEDRRSDPVSQPEPR